MSSTHFMKINSETIGFSFGLSHLKPLEEKIKTFPELFDGKSVSNAGYSYIMLYSYRLQCMIDNKSPIHNFEYFMNFTDSCMNDETLLKELGDFLSAWTESRGINLITEALEDTTKKNKQVRKRKLPSTSTK